MDLQLTKEQKYLLFVPALLALLCGSLLLTVVFAAAGAVGYKYIPTKV